MKGDQIAPPPIPTKNYYQKLGLNLNMFLEIEIPKK